MPIKLMIKLSWVANCVLVVVLLISIYVIFLGGAIAPYLKDEIDVNAQELTNDPATKPKTLEYYSDIWRTQVNSKSPVVPVEKVPDDWHKQLLLRHLKVQSIMSKGFAWVIINGHEHLLEELNEANKNDLKGNWQLDVGGQKVIVLKIQPKKGILVKFENSGKEVWLEVSAVESKEPKTSGKFPLKKNDVSGRMLGPNHRLMTAQEGEEILKRSDEYIEQMAPMVEYDSGRRSIGVKIRRVSANSKAYEYGFRENDVVTNVNGAVVESLDPGQIHKLIQKYRREKQIVVEVMRNNQKVRLTFDIRR
jgi:hypothetical protein